MLLVGWDAAWLDIMYVASSSAFGCALERCDHSGGTRIRCAGLQSDWEIVERGWKAHVLGEAEHTFKDALEGVKTLKVPQSRSLTA